MPVSEIIVFGDARILIWEVTESVDELSADLQVSTLALAENFGIEKRKREYLSTRTALKYLAGREVQIDYTAEGKPQDVMADYHISLSHSGQLVAVMLHPTRAVGVDIEVQSEKPARLFRRFMSKEEQHDFADGNNLHALQIVWSAKEALYKIIGREAVDFAASLRVSPFEPCDKGTIRAVHLPTNKEFELYYEQKRGYSLVACVE